MLFSGGEGSRLASAGALAGATCTWSLWNGYLDEPSGQRLVGFLDDQGIPLAHHHTSGHASVPDLDHLARAIAPERIVPIHTFGADGYPDVFDHVDLQPGGAWWDV